MTHITSAERIGRRKGLLIGLAVALEVKFGPAGRAIAEELRTVVDDEALDAVADRLPDAATIDELRAIYRPAEA
jgi:hypothetical protein